MSAELDEAERLLEEQRKAVIAIHTAELTQFGCDSLYAMNLSKEHYQMVKTIVKNEAAYLANSREWARREGVDNDELSEVLLELSANVAASVIAQIEPLVGVQPMRGPVDVVKMLWLKDGKLVLEDRPVEATSRKLQTGLAVKDAKHLISLFRNEHATSQLRMTSEEIASEIVREVILDLLGISNHDNTNLTDVAITPGLLRSKMLELSETIGELTTRAGNFAVGDKRMLELLKELEDFDAIPEDEVKTWDEVHYVGTLAKTIRVYCTKYETPYYGDATVVVGYRGFSETDANQSDAAYIICPYVPVLCGGIVMNPVTYQPVATFLTRYGKRVNAEPEQERYKETFRNHYKSLSFKL